MTENKKEEAEKTQQQECIKDLRRFINCIIPDSPIGFISVVQRKKRLNYSRNPEKRQQTADKHKHFPLADILSGKRALC
jgi:predicted RNA polymerase sigma factor